ncbi:MAG: hypothetical protein RL211_1651 [Pseudomonadota bacterium]
MKKKVVILIASTMVAFVLISHYFLGSVSDKYFQSESIETGVKTDIAFEYASVLQTFRLTPDHKAIAVAASYARSLGADFLPNMKRAGRAIRMLLSVANKKESPHASQATYEALVLLVRMPLDAEMTPLVNELAQRLAIALRSQPDESITIEKFQVKEVLAMFAARSRPDEATQVKTNLSPPSDAKDAPWLVKLAAARIGFSACIQSDHAFPDGLQTALNAAFPRAWLKNEARLGWDTPFMDVIIQTSRSPACTEQARKFKSLITD